MSSHFASSHYDSTHYDSSHYGDANFVPPVTVPGGGDSSKLGTKRRTNKKRILEADERLHRQLLREDDEVLAIIVAAIEAIGK